MWPPKDVKLRNNRRRTALIMIGRYLGSVISEAPNQISRTTTRQRCARLASALAHNRAPVTRQSQSEQEATIWRVPPLNRVCHLHRVVLQQKQASNVVQQYLASILGREESRKHPSAYLRKPMISTIWALMPTPMERCPSSRSMPNLWAEATLILSSATIVGGHSIRRRWLGMRTSARKCLARSAKLLTRANSVLSTVSRLVWQNVVPQSTDKLSKRKLVHLSASGRPRVICCGRQCKQRGSRSRSENHKEVVVAVGPAVTAGIR